ncbi:MAG: thiosulfate oxidation carrier protein SoxY [Betaproteobacteria bacterium RIFCSPHIGHO2_12_FULL_69_13]|nr:MAG: thiosulfate oxidation carrier protein SoxY [Betaproteobacteria bacterium RIFCSPHIGHO2_12_FULL_69_13]OGA71155.1 MAG: thiosulfate oxidation carrier protein SoxY [Betaproteobacteria bacterium RIFCSPLOWO2_12_FULL_68_20]
MNVVRRLLLVRAGAAALALGLLAPIRALAAWSKDAFAAKKADDALKSLGASGAEPSKDIVIEAPQIAENGAVVPIEIASTVPGTTSIAVLIEKNPYPLAGKFDFMEGALPFVKLNVKMAETSEVRVVASAGGKHYVATREIKVTIGGCGG